MLFWLGIRQEVMIFKETRCDGLRLMQDKCTKCGKCAEYCPLELSIPAAFGEKGFCCINCLYCYLVCPTRAIAFGGELGFLREQIAQYDEIIRRIA
jgi:MinD superfamily P-loop ATPase